MKNHEQIFLNNKFTAIVHVANGRWYLTLPFKKNCNFPTFRTCGGGLVRKPASLNSCSDPITWDTKEDAVAFLEAIVAHG